VKKRVVPSITQCFLLNYAKFDRTMPEPKVSLTTKDVSTLLQLQKEGQLVLQPEFQREGIWPRSAKSYLIDSILNNRPIPPIYMQRTTSPQTGRTEFAVIDGQQRLRAITEFVNGDFPISEVGKGSIAAGQKGKKFRALPPDMQQRLWNFDFIIHELSGYTVSDIRDIFARMNKYVVKLSKQELRHAQERGKFKDFVERLAKWPFWRNSKIFTDQQVKRMRAAEFSAELAILLIEGPQHGKDTVDLYYRQFAEAFAPGSHVEALLKAYIAWIGKALPDLDQRRYRRSNEFYSLIAALDMVSKESEKLSKMDPQQAGRRLVEFEELTRAKAPRGEAAEYVIAASKHTDDLAPRITRMNIIASLLG
jgi:hypothetical protein